jgi:hypothetical protein
VSRAAAANRFQICNSVESTSDIPDRRSAGALIRILWYAPSFLDKSNVVAGFSPRLGAGEPMFEIAPMKKNSEPKF